MKNLGIEITDASLPANVVFGPTGIPSGNYDLANFAWVYPSSDPAGNVPVWGCGGESNYLNYCNRAATRLLEASNSELDPARRAKDFRQADALMANDLQSIPLYSRPKPPDLEVRLHRDEEQPREQRLRLECRGLALDVVNDLEARHRNPQSRRG
jgi:ABC-type transport system substrate-binding protein